MTQPYPAEAVRVAGYLLTCADGDRVSIPTDTLAALLSYVEGMRDLPAPTPPHGKDER